MAGILVQQEGHVPAPVVIMNNPQERLEVGRPLMLSGQEQPSASPQVHRPEHHPPGVPAGP